MSILPDGTITFLFTDIEGSTRLWEKYPEDMWLALTRHDALIQEAVTSCGGHVFKSMGDAFCAAFPTPEEAVSAALRAQTALMSEVWPNAITLRVRMALHTGPVEQRDNDYFGQPLNRVARLLNIGHGGQVLLSQAVHDLLPEASTLIDLGMHRLKDLQQPENVWQLTAPDLPSDFPPLRSLTLYENNLPQQITSFIGREKEMAEVKALFAQTRLLTLTGSGGCGKTRLSLQTAVDLLDDFPDGVWFVELAAITDPSLVPQAMAQVLSLREETGLTLSQTLIETLKTKQTLLILDNCEHLLNACATLTEALLRSCPDVKILANSREGMGLVGEVVYRVPSLSLPDLKKPLTLQTVAQYESVRLFMERAVAVISNFSLTDANAPALAAICTRLDGIPLAIELAAARIRVLSLGQIAERLDDRFRLLTGGNRGALPRQQTLRALIDWSYGLLNPQEQTALARLSVFSGGWTLEAAESVVSGEGIDREEVLNLLTSLVDKSLAVSQRHGESIRYHLQETVRQYARELPEMRSEGDCIRRQHRDYFVALAEEADPHLEGPQQMEWFTRLETEHDNLRGALDFCTGDEESFPIAIRIVGAIYWFWYVRGYITEGRHHLEEALAHVTEQQHPKPLSRAVTGAGIFAREQGDYAAARLFFERNLELAREIGDMRGITGSLNNLGMLALDQGEYDSARPLYTESLQLARGMGDRHRVAAALNNLGNIVYYQGDYAAARTLYEESLGLAREMGDKHRIATFSNNMGLVARHQSDYSAALAFHTESLTLFQELEDRRGVAYVLEMLAEMAASQSLPERSVCLSGAAEVLRDATGGSLPLIDQQERDARLSKLRISLGADVYDAAWKRGQRMSLSDATSYALSSD